MRSAEKRRRRRPWQHGTTARVGHAGIALLSAAGVASSLYLGWTTDTELPPGAGFTGGFSAGWEHTLNQPAYFTFIAGLMVWVTSMVLALRPEVRSLLFHAVRLSGVVCVILTGVVFNTLLRGSEEFTGVNLFNDTVLHVIAPVAAPLVWLVVGPHGRLSGRAVVLSTVIPVGWLVVTLVRGPGLDWYPYDILDVPQLGYSGISVYVGVILGAYLLIATAMWGIDRLLRPRVRSASD